MATATSAVVRKRDSFVAGCGYPLSEPLERTSLTVGDGEEGD
jgi:hypothetical protein